MGIPMLKIRRPWDRLIFNMGIHIYIGKTSLYWDCPLVVVTGSIKRVIYRFFKSLQLIWKSDAGIITFVLDVNMIIYVPSLGHHRYYLFTGILNNRWYLVDITRLVHDWYFTEICKNDWNVDFRQLFKTYRCKVRITRSMCPGMYSTILAWMYFRHYFFKTKAVWTHFKNYFHDKRYEHTSRTISMTNSVKSLLELLFITKYI